MRLPRKGYCYPDELVTYYSCHREIQSTPDARAYSLPRLSRIIDLRVRTKIHLETETTISMLHIRENVLRKFRTRRL